MSHDVVEDKASETADDAAASTAASVDRLLHLIDHVSLLLSEQGPLKVFLYQNSLQAYENLPFHEALKKGVKTYGCQPYLTENDYREAVRRGRIRVQGLKTVLDRVLGEHAKDQIPCFGTRLELRLAMLEYPLRTGPPAELVWHVAESNSLRRVRDETSFALRAQMIAETRRWVVRDLRVIGSPIDGEAEETRLLPQSSRLTELLSRFKSSTYESWSDAEWEGFTLHALWRVCCDGVSDLPPFTSEPPPDVRHRDLLYKATGVDADVAVNSLLIRFCAAFLDQGFASWVLPRRNEGFYRSFIALYGETGGPAPDQALVGLSKELTRLSTEGITPAESILESLAILGIDEHEQEEFLAATTLSLRGWAGMIRQLELRPDLSVHQIPKGSLIEYLAIRLILDRLALAESAQVAMKYTGPLSGLRAEALKRIDPQWPPSVEQRAFLVFQLAQIAGLSPNILSSLETSEWAKIVEEMESFSSIERRRIFHLAYERRLMIQALDAVVIHSRRKSSRPASPRFQAVFCLDDREESLRRHLEELTSDVETFGVAGFFNLAMYYRGAADAHFIPLCPPVMRPQHWVSEAVGERFGQYHRRRAKTRRILGTASHRFHVGTRNPAIGALLTGAVGLLASIPLVARILFPKLSSKIRHIFGRIVQAPPITRLRLEREDPIPGPENGQQGFSLDEMANAGERMLRDIGLTSGFARLVLLLGHRSDSLNNPHNSAYNCGACGCAAGGPNARAMAEILNDPRVREILATRGLQIPAETSFVGGYHNTCNDTMFFYDVDLLAESHRHEFETSRLMLKEACQRNAHERCRRFMSAPLSISFEAAQEHVEIRSEDLAQARPELGHATNAITLVGRREWSRGLFLDRRAFLASYDPTQDTDDKTILTRVLSAAVPVCAGISLQYYFSRVDPTGFGSGTKLPQNLAGLVGVMDGAGSDLRTGLPWQGVEIHEPVRQLFIIETTPQSMLDIIDRVEIIGRLCRNEWVHLAVLDPVTREVSVYENGQFKPYHPQSKTLPHTTSSVDWYRGWRENLDFAEIGK